jgi:hypothetical protein
MSLIWMTHQGRPVADYWLCGVVLQVVPYLVCSISIDIARKVVIPSRLVRLVPALSLTCLLIGVSVTLFIAVETLPRLGNEHPNGLLASVFLGGYVLAFQYMLSLAILAISLVA